MIKASEALTRLKEGNQRYLKNERVRSVVTCPDQRSELADGQEPFAIVLGCADSRVPAEIVFDQGVGDLFVIRVAGNIVAPSQVGSVEFAADQFGTRLVVVLGHSHCGAVKATLEEMKNPADTASPNIASIVNRVMPALKGLDADVPAEDYDALVELAVKANIAASVTNLQEGSAILENLIASDGLIIIGAEYDLASGVVDFFDLPSRG